MARKFSIRGLLSLKDEASPVAKKAQGRISKLSGAMKVGLVAGAAAATAGLFALVKGIGAAVGAAKTQEEAVSRLNASLASLGPNADKVSEALQKQASALQKTSTFGDEAIIEAQALIASFVKEEDSIKAATKATLDLAAAKGIDLRAAADLVAKSLGSSINALGRYGVEVTGAVGSTERLDSLVGNISNRFGGQAAKAAETFTGRMLQLAGAFGDLLEPIGDAVIKNDALRGSIKSVTDFLQSDKLQNGIKSVVSRLGSLVTVVVQVVTELKPFATVVFNVAKTVVEFSLALNKLIIAGLQPVIARVKEFIEVLSPVIGFIKRLGGTIGEAIGDLNEFADGLLNSGDAAKKGAKGLNDLGKAADGATPPLKMLGETSNELSELLKNLGITTDQELNTALQKNQEQIQTLQAAYDAELITVEQLNEGLAALALKAEELTDGLKEQETQVGNTAEQFDGLTESVGSGAEALRQNKQAADDLNNSLNSLRATIRFTSSDFDELRRASGNAAAVEAGLAGGGTLSQGGRVINLPGGGSRLINIASRFSSNNGRFNIDGTPRRIG